MARAEVPSSAALTHLASPMNSFQSQHAQDVLLFSLQRHGPDFRLGEHFRLVEMASKDGADLVKVHPALLLLLEQVRRHFDRPVHLTSGYRTAEHNRRIGGQPNSKHLLGMAADVQVHGVPPGDVAAYADRLGVGGRGSYPTFVHLDVDGRNRRW